MISNINQNYSSVDGMQRQYVGINIGSPLEPIPAFGNCSYTLEQHLASFSSVDEYRFLWATWQTEKAIYCKRLETVANTFNTYSSHNAEHSAVIIARIESLLGEERIRLLSPTDTWLLLQCAYTHDLGMCVSEDDKEKALYDLTCDPERWGELFRNKDFIKYLKDIDKTNSNLKYRHDAFTYSVRFILRKIETGNKHGNYDEVRRFINQILSPNYSSARGIFQTVTMDYFRKRHAHRAFEILISEAQDSTYKDIFPVRLRRMVAIIDECHGGDWKNVLDTLPRRNNGIYTDHIHPRFVAALLRIGDLLDLDSNRFNFFLGEQVGEYPESSAVHRLKHMSVSEFLVDTRDICIEARYGLKECRDFLDKYYFRVSRKERSASFGVGGSSEYDDEEFRRRETIRIVNNSAKSMREWITWIISDLEMFAAHWNAIVPYNMTGSIAFVRKSDIYIDNIKVEDDELDLRYRISSARASQIIEGAGLYKLPLTFIRELTQNSVDTTRIQVFKNAQLYLNIQNKTDDVMLDSTGMQKSLFQILQNMLDNYGVTVQFRYVPAKDSNSQSYDTILITFSDKGIGITYEKLKQMREIGNIILTKEEKADITAMPSWLKPTGEFGIGMQSAFTVTDDFIVETYPRYELRNGVSGMIKRTIRFNCTELGGDIVNSEEKKVYSDRNRFGSDVKITLTLSPQNIMKLFKYDSLYSLQNRSVTVVDPRGLASRLWQYIYETFMPDIVPLYFTFLDFGETDKITIKFPDFKYSYSGFPGELNYWGALEDIVTFWYNKADAIVSRDESETKYEESVLLIMKRSEQADETGSVRLFYKGIRVGGDAFDIVNDQIALFRIPGVSLDINIMSERAGDLLEINRDRVKSEGCKTVLTVIRNALKSFYATTAHTLLSANKAHDSSEQSAEIARLARFFSTNPSHVMILRDILTIFSDSFNLSKNDITNVIDEIIAQNDKTLPCSIFVALPSLAVVSELPIQSLVRNIPSEWLWYTDFNFKGQIDNRYPLNGDEQNKGYVLIRDYISEVYDLKYKQVRTITFENVEGNSLYLYKLTDNADAEKMEFTDISEKDFLILCGDILKNYFQQYYKAAGTDRDRTGEEYPVFPAIRKYKSISVKQMPAEASDVLAKRHIKFIMCPFSLRKLIPFIIRCGAESSYHVQEYMFDTDKLFDSNKDQLNMILLRLLKNKSGMNLSDEQLKFETELMREDYRKLFCSIRFFVPEGIDDIVQNNTF